MYGREKLTIKGRFFNVCFLKKKLSGPKDRSFTPPENLPGEGLKHTFIREKWRFSAVGGNGGLSSNLPPKRKNRPEDRSVENFENGGGGGSARHFSDELKLRCKMRFSSVKISNLACCSRKHPTAFKR